MAIPLTEMTLLESTILSGRGMRRGASKSVRSSATKEMNRLKYIVPRKSVAAI